MFLLEQNTILFFSVLFFISINVNIPRLMLYISFLPTFVIFNSLFHNWSEIFNQALDRPCCRIPKCTYSVRLNGVTDFLQHVNLSEVSLANLHSGQNIEYPVGTLPARRTLPTTLMLLEMTQVLNRTYDVCTFIHHDHGASSQTTTSPH